MTHWIKHIGRFGAVLAAFSLALTGQAAAQETESNRAIIAKALDAWAAGTGGPFDLLTDDADWTIAGNSLASKTYPTKEDFMREVIRPFNARMTERLIPTVKGIYADGDTVVAHFDARSLVRDGKPYFNNYVWIMRMRDGRIVEVTAFFDAHAFDDLWTRVTPAQN